VETGIHSAHGQIIATRERGDFKGSPFPVCFEEVFILIKKGIDRFFHIIAEISGNLTVMFMFVLIATVAIQILARELVHAATPWSEELARYMMIWICFIGSVRVLIRHDHMIVDFLSSKYRGLTRKYLNLLIYLIELIFFAFLLLFGWKLCQTPVVLNARTSALHISRLFVYGCMPISMLFNTLYSLYAVILTLKAIVRPSTEDEMILCVGQNETNPSNEVIIE
jgi:TRAP-type C4-dicarboxylate transport system permease small subunit